MLFKLFTSNGVRQTVLRNYDGRSTTLEEKKQHQLRKVLAIIDARAIQFKCLFKEIKNLEIKDLYS